MVGLLDKVKHMGTEAAKKGTEAAKKGVEVVQDKVEVTQTRRKADDLAKQLGYLIVRERGGGPAAGPEVDRLAGEISALEKKLSEAADAADAAGSSPDEGTG